MESTLVNHWVSESTGRPRYCLFLIVSFSSSSQPRGSHGLHHFSNAVGVYAFALLNVRRKELLKSIHEVTNVWNILATCNNNQIESMVTTMSEILGLWVELL